MSRFSVYFFTKYDRSGASSRYRSYQYRSALHEAGLIPIFLPLFTSSYLSHKYAHGRARSDQVLLALLKRVWAVLTVPRRATVFIEYELLPFCPAVLERWLVWRGCRLVVDYDDALFHQYDEHPRAWVRRWLGHKIAQVMRRSHTVIAGNEYLACYARQAGASRVVLIPTVVDLTRYPPVIDRLPRAHCVIGWIGSPSTAPYLQAIAPALAEVCKTSGARIRLVGSGAVSLPEVPVEIVPWFEAEEVSEIAGFDIGIMPLPDEPWARGKCGFKLIQYMACAVPVVASPVGVNNTIVSPQHNGFLADTLTDWVNALQYFICHAPERQRMGQAGRQTVEDRYCLAVTAPLLIQVVQQAVDDVS